MFTRRSNNTVQPSGVPPADLERSAEELAALMRMRFGQFEIVLDNDPAYSFGSSDNPRTYGRSFLLDDEPYTPTSLHTVRIISTNDEKQTASCILGAAGGASGIHEHSATINGDALIIAVGPFIASLQLPTLDLTWRTRTDSATCLGIYHSIANRCYISHGELEVARISYTGAIDWTNGGADIFTNGFTVTDDHIEAVDWNADVYVWDIRTGKPVVISPNNTVQRTGVPPADLKRSVSIERKA